jgi:branched-chain amino acid transport system ATP-binding protein
MLAVHGLRKRFGGLVAVADASLAVEARSITALIGPNGAGKTTLFDLVTGFQSPDAGQVRLGGASIVGWPAHRIAQAGLVRTFQTTRTLRRMTVVENLLVAAPDQPGDRAWPVFLRPGRVAAAERRAREQAMGLLERVRLAGLAASYAGVLSGGQRKLLELARALMLRPRILLLDEPFAGVNPVLGEELGETIRSLRDEDGITTFFVEHDMGAVMRLADRVVVMAEGRVLVEGTPDEIRRDPRVIDAYLGSPL